MATGISIPTHAEIVAAVRQAGLEWDRSPSIQQEWHGNKSGFVARRVNRLLYSDRRTTAPPSTAAKVAPAHAVSHATSDTEREWKSSPALRQEIGDDRDADVAYRRRHPANGVRSDTPGSQNLRTEDLASQASAEWAASAALQAEFCNDRDAYIAYRRRQPANGVRLDTPGPQKPRTEDLASQAGAEWAASAALQAEFCNDRAAYLAYRRRHTANGVRRTTENKVEGV